MNSNTLYAMSQLFHPSMNYIVRIGLPVLIILLAGLGGLGYYAASSPYVTEVGVAKAQPVAFSHKQHVGGLGLDCRYCHTFVETANTASLPPTATCMGCHNQVAAANATLELVRQSAEDETPLEWVRVHNLADYVYFNHAIHVKQGVGCETCHGRIDQMPVVMKVNTM
ncbi:MAG: cytochrome c3 family protein, partial [Caldilineaceae bacterium]|nr:cytochrome c3 family protein [Caldilineaceae bacterium]